MLLRPCEADDVPAITAIYAREVELGTASFELTPPDAAEMRARHEALVSGGYPYLVAEAEDGTVPAPTGPGRPTGRRSRTRSMSRPRSAAPGSPCASSKRSSPRPRRGASGR